MENILVVIDELGNLLDKYKSNIKFKDVEIEHLKKRIERLEQYQNFYSEGEGVKKNE